MAVLVAAVGALVVAVSCAPATAGAPRQYATLVAENQSWTDWTVEYRTVGSWQRVGRVGALSTATFRLPSSLSASPAPIQFRLRSRLEGRTVPIPDSVTLPHPTSEVLIRIPGPANLSHVLGVQ